MNNIQRIHIGLLSPATANRPHFANFERILPPEISLINEGLGLLGDSYNDLAGKADQVIARAVDFVRRHDVQGLILTGGFVSLFNPGLEEQVTDAIQLPVASAISAVKAALQTFSIETLLLVTPFEPRMNAVLEKHLSNLGITVFPGPRFGFRKPGEGAEVVAEELFDKVEHAFRQNPKAEGIYFQGATLDPLPIIQRLEDKLAIPVIASNPAMLWNILSKLGLKFLIKRYGKLLSSWPALA